MLSNKVLVSDEKTANQLIQVIQNAKELYLDTESSGPQLIGQKFINMFKATTTGLSITAPGVDTVWYVPISHTTGNLGESLLVRLLSILADSKTRLWAHNWKHDLKAFDALGINLRDRNLADTQILMWLVGIPDNDGGFGLKSLAKDRLGFEMATFEDTLGDHESFADIPPEQAIHYACSDAVAVRLLAEKYLSTLQSLDLTGAFDREMRMVRVLRHMEDTGIGLDVLRISNLYREMQAVREPLLAEWDWLVGCNPNSPKQVKENLFDKGHWPVIGRSKTGQPSTTAENMAAILASCKPGTIGHRAAEIRLELAEASKIASTYGENLIEIANQYPDGRLHPSYHGTGTDTGRLSSSYPNAQNIPVRTPLGKRVQEAFTGAPGSTILSADYSQIELRCMAHLAGSGPLYDGYRAGADVHQATGDRLGVSRTAGKTINFAILYGAGKNKLARTIGTTPEKAKELLDMWYEDNASVVSTLDSYKSFAYRHGFIRIESGRIRRFPEMPLRGEFEPRSPYRFGTPKNQEFYENVLKPRWSDERKAGNTAVQGFAADIVKEAMIQVYDQLVDTGLCKLQAQIHDDIKLEVPAGVDVKEVEVRFLSILRNAYPLSVPLEAEAGKGSNWLEAKG